MKKNRETKTIFERFNHSQVANLDTYKEEVKTSIINYIKKLKKKNKFISSIDLEKILIDLNLPKQGHFYMKGLGEQGHINKNGNEIEGKWKDGRWLPYYDVCDAYNFSHTDEPLPRVTLKNGKEYVKFIVLMNDPNGRSLILYPEHRHDLFWLTIVNKNNPVVLEGNIGHYIN